MFSKSSIADLVSNQFVAIKADPKSPTFDQDVMRKYKSTPFVPEVVLIGPDEQVLGRLHSGASVDQARDALQTALKAVKPGP